MKNVLCFLLLSMLSLPGFAQDKYTDFSVNGKFGLVKVDNLEEYLEPTYPKRIASSSDYLGFKKENELFFYNKTSGKMLQFLVAEDEYSIYRRGSELMHVVKDGKSALLDRNMKLVKIFPYRYTTIRHPYWSTNLIAKSKDGYDIYDLQESYKLGQRKIDAGSYFISDFTQNDKIWKNCTVFYGKDKVIVYDDKFKILKVVAQKASNYSEVISVLKPYYTAISDDPDALDPSLSYDPNWSSRQIENGYKICESTYHYPGLQLKLKDIFKVRNGDYSDVTVFSTKANDTYTFKLDKVGKKALIPLKYQQLMGLEVLKK